MNYGTRSPENLSELPTKQELRVRDPSPGGPGYLWARGALLGGFLVCCLVIRFAC